MADSVNIRKPVMNQQAKRHSITGFDILGAAIVTADLCY